MSDQEALASGSDSSSPQKVNGQSTNSADIASPLKSNPTDSSAETQIASESNKTNSTKPKDDVTSQEQTPPSNSRHQVSNQQLAGESLSIENIDNAPESALSTSNDQSDSRHIKSSNEKKPIEHNQELLLKEEKEIKLQTGPVVELDVFHQILEMDEDESDRAFSKELVENFFLQVRETFAKFDTYLSTKDLEGLHESGHYLKGSSAALGITKMKTSCESIQNLGKQMNEEGMKPISMEDALKKLNYVIKRVKIEQEEAQIWFEDMYKCSFG